MNRLILNYTKNSLYQGLEYSLVLAPVFISYSMQMYINDHDSAWRAVIAVWAVISFLLMIAVYLQYAHEPLSFYHKSELKNGGRILYLKNSFPVCELTVAIDEDYADVRYEKKKRLQSFLAFCAVFVLAVIWQIALVSNNRIIAVGLSVEIVLFVICVMLFNCGFSPFKTVRTTLIGTRKINEKLNWENIV